MQGETVFKRDGLHYHESGEESESQSQRGYLQG